MYCPNCSTEASTEQKFCRSCGMELQAVAELISSQAGITKPEKRKEVHLQRGQRAMLVWGMILTFGSVAAGSSLKILGREHIQIAGGFTPYLMVLTLLTAFFGMGLMCYAFMSGNARSHKRTARSEPTIKLRPDLLSKEQPAVTEQTTAFLESFEAQIKVRDTSPQKE